MDYYLVCNECEKGMYLGQGKETIFVEGNNPDLISEFISDHYDHGLEIKNDHTVSEEDVELD